MAIIHHSCIILITLKIAASIHKKDMLLPVTLGFNPTRHPNMLARSPTIAVNNPIIPRDTKKHGHPPHIPAGGINAKMI